MLAPSFLRIPCILAALTVVGCGVTPPVAATAPPPWAESGYEVLGAGAPPREISRSVRPVPSRAARSTGSRSGDCLTRLRQAGVKFRELPALRGVDTPVRVDGPLGGIAFFSNHGRLLDLDCRLAVALVELGKDFHELGITRARFSGAYDYRTTRTGRLSHHAFGLAIDIHEVWVREKRYSVDKAFEKGRGCPSSRTVLNELACSFKASGLFEEVLTPDYNWDHRDHLHVAVPKRANVSTARQTVPGAPGARDPAEPGRIAAR